MIAQIVHLILDQLALNLVGPIQHKPALYPLAVLHLKNRLYMLSQKYD